MSQTVNVKLTIYGVLPQISMTDWVIHRGCLLDLDGWVKHNDNSCIEIVASGDKILIDALEVACSLGPAKALVESITRQEIPCTASIGRQRKQFVRYSPALHDKSATHS